MSKRDENNDSRYVVRTAARSDISWCTVSAPCLHFARIRVLRQFCSSSFSSSSLRALLARESAAQTKQRSPGRRQLRVQRATKTLSPDNGDGGKCSVSAVSTAQCSPYVHVLRVFSPFCSSVETRSDMSVSPASIRRSKLGEGPHWDPDSRTLIYVDAPVGDLCRLDVVTRETSSVHLDGLVTIAIPYKTDPNLNVITLNREVRQFNWTTFKSEVLTSVDSDRPNNRFNDGKCDVTGRLWAGTTGRHNDEKLIEKENGSLFSIDPDTLRASAEVTDVNMSNGMTWSPDNSIMFYIDSYTRTVYSFGFDAPSGQLFNRQIVVDFNSKDEYKKCGYPDGMTVDTHGKLWVACYAAGRVINIDPHTGKLLRTVLLPVSNTTSCCFGGENYDELYVTSAWKGLTPEQMSAEPLAGSVFKVSCLGVKGFAAYAFNR